MKYWTVAMVGVVFGLLVGATFTAYLYVATLVAYKMFEFTGSNVVLYGTMITFVLSIFVGYMNVLGARKLEERKPSNG